jgi:hypothetical protein
VGGFVRGKLQGVAPQVLESYGFWGELMKLLLMASIFCTGLYLGLNAEPNGELVRTMEQIKALMGGDLRSTVRDLMDSVGKR